MKQLKLSLLLSLPLLFVSGITEAKEAHAQAKHLNLGDLNERVKNAIAFLDGQLGRIDGNTFGLILNVRSKLQAILFGDRDPNNHSHRVGHYLFNGKRYSIAELAEIESQHVGNAELNALLIDAKKSFEELVAQFIGQASGTKSFLVILIEESCYRRNRKNSLLLTWATSPEEHETVIFHTEVQSFRALNDFCQDLTNFLEDLMFSCPKAMDQFKKKREQYAHEHGKQ
jgi:hypothetical protein